MSDRMCQKCFEKFCAGDFSLDNAPRLGRPVEVDSDQIENNQHSTAQEIADILKISKLIKLWVKMKNMSSILWKNPYLFFGQPNINHTSAWSAQL